MLTLLTNNMAAVGITNVVPILGSVTDPELPAASVDLVLMVDVYHEFNFPAEIMEAICRSVKPGGRVVFVEYRGEDPDVPIKPLHKMTEIQVKREMSVCRSIGFKPSRSSRASTSLSSRNGREEMPQLQARHNSRIGSGRPPGILKARNPAAAPTRSTGDRPAMQPVEAGHIQQPQGGGRHVAFVDRRG